MSVTWNCKDDKPLHSDKQPKCYFSFDTHVGYAARCVPMVSQVSAYACVRCCTHVSGDVRVQGRVRPQVVRVCMLRW